MQETSFKVTVCGQDSPELAKAAIDGVEKRLLLKEYDRSDIEYIKKLKLKLIEGGLDIGEKDLERLRALCKLWDVELKPANIVSHRRFLGTIIVAVKKLLFPMVRVMLKDSFKQQRDFNAAAVSMLAEMLNRQSHSGNSRADA